MAFFQESQSGRQPAFNAPASVLILIGVLIAAHMARVWSPHPGEIANAYALVPLAYTAQAPLLGRLVTPFSHMFLHIDSTHLAVNCLWLLVFGSVIARRFGAAPFFLYFLLCGLAGAAFFVAMDWGQDVGAIGASGAISGLMGGAFRMIRLREPYLNSAVLPLEPLFSRQVLTVSAVWLALNLVTGYFGLGLVGAGQAIAWQDHMGGYFAGLLLAGPFDRFFGLAAKLRRRSA